MLCKLGKPKRTFACVCAKTAILNWSAKVVLFSEPANFIFYLLKIKSNSFTRFNAFSPSAVPKLTPSAVIMFFISSLS